MSAIADGDTPAVVQVLFILHESFDLYDLTGPLKILQSANHIIDERKKITSPAFKCQTAGHSGPDGNRKQLVKSAQGLSVTTDMDLEDAEADLADFDMLVILGGDAEAAVADRHTLHPPVGLTKAFAKLQEDDPMSRERTLLAIATGSLFLARAGVLQGLSATTCKDSYAALENAARSAWQDDTGLMTDVCEERYVVNNGRFDVAEGEENPFVFRKKPSNTSAAQKKARRGSEAYKLARRRESVIKRADLPLGGLRVITTSGGTGGMDAALYLVAAYVDIPTAHKLASHLDLKWEKGLCVEAVDV